MSDTKLSPEFTTGVLRPISQGQVLVPALRAWLTSSFPGMTVELGAFDRREPDFWFHPSTHPSWSEKALWLWMVAPQLLEEEPLSAEFMLAVTVGHFWHELIQFGLVDLGLMTADVVELSLVDESLRTRGKTDGMRYGEIIEVKTQDPRKHGKTETVEDYIKKNPGYYLQAHEYMRMARVQKERVLLVSPVYPFLMSEFVIEFDPTVSERTTSKYRSVLNAVANGEVPLCSGCKKGSCPARFVCENVDDRRLLDIVRRSQEEG